MKHSNLLCGVLVLVALAVLSAGSTATAMTQGAADPSTLVPANQVAKWKADYPEARWSTLSDFEYPIPASPKELIGRKLKTPPAVEKLNGTKVAIRGYMLPLDFDGKGVGRFIVGPTIDSCCFGITGLPNEWIVVTMNKRTAFTRFAPITVFGKIEVGEVVAKGGFIESFYRISGDAIAVMGESTTNN